MNTYKPTGDGAVAKNQWPANTSAAPAPVAKLAYPDGTIRLAGQCIPDSGLERSSLRFFGSDS